MINALDRAIGKLGSARWLAAIAGSLVSAASAAGLWFLVALKDFSSNLRDAYEAPPGPVQYAVFGLVCAFLLVSAALGVVVAALGLRRRHGA
ncbi:hypothetical protein [Lysobacter niastensis]|uniref:hypothetical protein n=1 Tax=Lysobacter niastensis TaxID=380629 RepID=UPI00286AEBD0|nr:hypothetical protein [Lysobacter niastensis]